MDNNSELEDFTDVYFTGASFSYQEDLEDGRAVVTLPGLQDAAEAYSNFAQAHLLSKSCVNALKVLERAIRELKNPLSESRVANLPSRKAIGALYVSESELLVNPTFDADNEFNIPQIQNIDDSEKRPLTNEEAEFALECIVGTILADEAMVRIADDMPLVLTRMIGKESELYGAIDRLRSEAEFRAAATLPLVALIATASCLLDWRLAFLAIAPVTLFRLGINKRREAESLTIQAIAAGRAQTAVLTSLDVTAVEMSSKE